MTGDPRRIAGAHTVDRVNYAEMVELAADGAKVMHANAAELARITAHAYVVKGLRSNFGTTIDEGARPDSLRPVSGVTALRDVTFVRVIQGDIDDADARRALELEAVPAARRARRLGRHDQRQQRRDFLHLRQRERRDRAPRARRSQPRRARPARTAARSRSSARECAGRRASCTASSTRSPMRAIEIIHSTDSNITISVLVAEEEDVLGRSKRYTTRSGWAAAPAPELSRTPMSIARRHDPFTAMLTPFDRNDGVDLREAARLARFCVAHGNDGLVVCGTTGESPALEDDEKLALFARSKRRSARRGTVDRRDTGQQHAPLDRAHRRAEEARRRRDSGRRSATTTSRPQDGMLRHFGAIARGDVAAGHPLQHPGRTARTCCRRRCSNWRARHPNIAASKSRAADFAQIPALVRDAPARTSGLGGRRLSVLAVARARRRRPGQRRRPRLRRASCASWPTRTTPATSSGRPNPPRSLRAVQRACSQRPVRFR